MNIVKISISILVFAIAFSLNGCQGNNSDSATGNGVSASISNIPDSNTTSTQVTVILPVSSSVLATNNEIINIDIRVFDSANNPYSSGNIVKVNPSDVLSGRDIGTFDKISSSLVNGVASFVYTAPTDLTADTSNIVFAFYHDSNSSNVKIYTMSIVPKTNQTVLTNYRLQTSNPTDVTMSLESSKRFSYTIYDTDNKEIEDSMIQSFTISSLNASLGTLADNFNNKGKDITIKNKNNVSINLISNTKSGIVPLKVDAIFTNINGITQTLSEVFNIIILSGPPSAISLSYASTVQVIQRAKFVDKWVVTVTDKYSNLVNSNPAVSMGMIAGYTQSSAATGNAGNYLHFAPSTSGGSINATSNNFTATAGVFNNVDDTNDVLVVYGTGYKYNASGKWDIKSNSSTVLDLIDDYSSTNTSRLGFAIGNNQREDTCDIGSKWIANVYPTNDNYTIDTTGSLEINVEYDYYLVGKSTMLWINLVGAQNSTASQIRIGESKKITLRGTGLNGDSYDYAKGFEGSVRLEVSISNTVEQYKNANFDYQVVITGDDTNWTKRGDSMSDGNITDCSLNNGVGYVDITVNTPAANSGTISIVKIIPQNEF